MKRIKIIGRAQPLIRDMGPAQPLVDPSTVAAALGAVEIGTVIDGGSPPSFAALRHELSQRLMSAGGRPALTGTDRRQKIPLSNDDWTRLCELAQRVADADTRPAPAQVASALLHLALANLDAAETLIRGRPIADRHWVQREAPSGEALLRFVAKVRQLRLIQDDVTFDEADCARWIGSSVANVESEVEASS